MDGLADPRERGQPEFLVHAVTAAGPSGTRSRSSPTTPARTRRRSRGARSMAGRARSRGLGGARRRRRAGRRRLVGERPLEAADLVVSLGGDGTMLRAVRLLDGASVPLLGVNLGVLGYLTEIEPPALTAALERFVAGPEAGRWHLDERMMLDVSDIRRRDLAGAQRGRGREARVGSHGAPVGADRRRAVHQLRGRRTDRLHADGLHRLLALGARPDRLAASPGAAAHAGVAAHALRPRPRPRSRPRRSSSRSPASSGPGWPSTASSSPR